LRTGFKVLSFDGRDRGNEKKQEQGKDMSTGVVMTPHARTEITSKQRKNLKLLNVLGGCANQFYYYCHSPSTMESGGRKEGGRKNETKKPTHLKINTPPPPPPKPHNPNSLLRIPIEYIKMGDPVAGEEGSGHGAVEFPEGAWFWVLEGKEREGGESEEGEERGEKGGRRRGRDGGEGEERRVRGEGRETEEGREKGEGEGNGRGRRRRRMGGGGEMGRRGEGEKGEKGERRGGEEKGEGNGEGREGKEEGRTHRRY
jgi:hypothetical protein